MRGKQKDIFISYRRSDGKHTARLFKSEFEKRGYRAFLDFDDLTDGKFDKRIENAILDAPIFLMILTNDYFARCNDKDDWVRREIECALKNEKVIIPVNYDGNLNGIPDYLEPNLKNEIGLHQFSTVYADSAFEVTFDKMIKDRVAKVINVIQKEDPQPQPQPRPRPKPAQTDFNTEYNRCMTTEQYPEAFALCLNEAVVRGSVAQIKSKADKAIEKLKGRILIPDCVAHVSYDWLIDRLSAKGYSPIKTHKKSISHKKIIFSISDKKSKNFEIGIDSDEDFGPVTMMIFFCIFSAFIMGFRDEIEAHLGRPTLLWSVLIIFLCFLIVGIVRMNICNQRKKKAIQDVAKICLEESER